MGKYGGLIDGIAVIGIVLVIVMTDQYLLGVIALLLLRIVELLEDVRESLAESSTPRALDG